MTLWLWLIMRDRVPVRISHSMYLMELCILSALGLILWIRMAADDRSRKTGSVTGVICLAAVLLYSVMALPFTIRSLDLDTQAKAREISLIRSYISICGSNQMIFIL